MGEVAALATSGLWTISSIFFTTAGKKIGALSVNAYRTVIAVALLGITHVIVLGTVIPLANGGQWFWMGMSGIVGLGIGDYGLFAAYVRIGPRRSVLVMALAPIFASITAYLMLGEIIATLGIAGIAVTLIGIVMVIVESEDRSGELPLPTKQKGYGLLFALIGAAGQGVGLVLSKKGIELIPGVTLNPLSATLMRLILGAVFVWMLSLVTGRLPELRDAVKSKEGMSNTLSGSFVGPFLGITLSMVAVTYAAVGIAQTLMSLMPVLIIPTLWVVGKQRTSWRGMLGAGIAVVGVTILFLA
jgi:drug/metabolite transporter (DMT)-like permease